MQATTWKPFQQQIIDMIAKDSDGRKIVWIWEHQGGTGKSKVLVPYLQEHRGALVIDPTAKRDVMRTIKAKHDECELFRAKPIIFLNIPRAKNDTVKRPEMYGLLEQIQDNFLDAKSGQMLKWEGIYPHVFVTANEPPFTEPPHVLGRLEVYFINPMDELVPDTITQTTLDEHQDRAKEKRDEYDKSLKQGKKTDRYKELELTGGAGGSGTLSPEAKATVVAELKSKLTPMENSVVTLRTNAPSLVHALSDESLLILGADNVEQARDPNVKAARAKWLPTFLANLKACLVGPESAFPSFEIDKNTTGNSAGIRNGRRFTGEYVKGLGLVQA